MENERAIQILRGTLRQIAAKAKIAREGGLSIDPRWALERIEEDARTALAEAKVTYKPCEI